MTAVAGTGVHLPAWTAVVAWTTLGIGLVCALWTLLDVARRPPAMPVMRVVWPVTMLFGGLLWLWFYLRWGREPRPESERRPGWVSVATGTSHCGAGCTLGDVIGETLVLLVPGTAAVAGAGTLFRDEMYARWTVDLVLAFVIGVALQYAAIVPMRHLRPGRGLAEAVKADTLSILAWQVGMYGLMAIVQLWLAPAWFGGRLPVASAQFWAAMQLAMLVGFATSTPANVWLLRRGIKEPM
ncbi:DUF4396 domain-containing protein [Cellulomonas sp. SG140]|uniref:DUF4396 domain-containing protein n=1 Tax=Cellulomonas sp. SG140 TaxID=2976536 RepID=UPI0021E82971|nr:DUF4396 domain-containing protein [Cellulomonas sp. SG140]